ncbi:MAG: haloalkane dehalogenase [Rhodospirillaceae bacterium]|nr:haloalkane dehalogenase [Rhodospirillaceae bacterium]
MKSIDILDSRIAYAEHGAGAPAVFLHGNPTSSYLWRNVIPHVAPAARCLAPDLIGMGASGKNPAGSYSFADHAHYLDAWFDAVVPQERIVLVLHDWGGALGFHWARRHAERVRGIAYMETIVSPIDSWDDWPENARNIFQAMRSPAGEKLILEKNLFIEGILPGAILRKLTAAEHDAYRAPFREAGEGRRPMLTWPRQIPIAGEPRDVAEIAAAYAAWLAEAPVPKLFVNAEPGSILVGRQRETCRRWPNQTEITVKGAHFIQEDSPNEIGSAIAAFLARLPA